ncbi:hypothetical protein D9M72_593670 [compost metagenome]
MNELLASLGLTRYIWDVCAGNAKVVKFASRELVQLVYSVTVTAPVVVRAEEVHGIIPSSLRNWCSIHLVCCPVYNLLFSLLADPSLHSCLAGSARRAKSIRLVEHKIAVKEQDLTICRLASFLYVLSYLVR